MRRKNLIVGLFVSLVSLAAESPASAAEVVLDTTIITLAANTQSDANLIQLPVNTATSCNVSTVSRAYIRRENKHMMAAAMTAASQHLTVTVTVETNAEPLYIHDFNPSPLPCEVVSILLH